MIFSIIVKFLIKALKSLIYIHLLTFNKKTRLIHMKVLSSGAESTSFSTNLTKSLYSFDIASHVMLSALNN